MYSHLQQHTFIILIGDHRIIEKIPEFRQTLEELSSKKLKYRFTVYVMRNSTVIKTEIRRKKLTPALVGN